MLFLELPLKKIALGFLGCLIYGQNLYRVSLLKGVATPEKGYNIDTLQSLYIICYRIIVVDLRDKRCR